MLFKEITDFESVGAIQVNSPEVEASLAQVKQLVNLENVELENNSRRRPSTGVQRVNRKINALGLQDHLEVYREGREISLRDIR